MGRISPKLTRYLELRKSGIYGFRYDIPGRLRGVMGCGKIIRSLDTRDLGEALARLKPEVAKAKLRVAEAERQLAADHEPGPWGRNCSGAPDLLTASLDLLDELLSCFEEKAEEMEAEHGVPRGVAAAFTGRLFSTPDDPTPLTSLSAAVRGFRRAVAEEVAAEVRGRDL